MRELSLHSQADELRAHTNCVRYVPCTPLCRSIIVSVCLQIYTNASCTFERRLSFSLTHAKSRAECEGFGQELLCLSATAAAFASNSATPGIEKEQWAAKLSIRANPPFHAQRQTAFVCLSAATRAQSAPYLFARPESNFVYSLHSSINTHKTYWCWEMRIGTVPSP